MCAINLRCLSDKEFADLYLPSTRYLYTFSEHDLISDYQTLLLLIVDPEYDRTYCLNLMYRYAKVIIDKLELFMRARDNSCLPL